MSGSGLLDEDFGPVRKRGSANMGLILRVCGAALLFGRSTCIFSALFAGFGMLRNGVVDSTMAPPVSEIPTIRS